MKYIKKFENVKKDLYVCNLSDDDLEYYYDKIVNMNLEYHFYRSIGGRNLIYVYVSPEEKINNFVGWYKINDMENTDQEANLKDYIKLLKAKKEADKYNL